MRSTSSLCRDFLADYSAPITAEDLCDKLRSLFPDEAPTAGGCSGFLNRATKAGAVTVANIDGHYTYVVTDKLALAAMNVRDGKGEYKGGAEGRTVHRKAKHLPTTQSIQARLLDLAAELELARSPLATYSTEELLAELGRRTK